MTKRVISSGPYICGKKIIADTAVNSDVLSSMSGSNVPMSDLQYRHLPPVLSQLNRGKRSYHCSVCPHMRHRDLSSFTGRSICDNRRYSATSYPSPLCLSSTSCLALRRHTCAPKKDPTSIPNMPNITMMYIILMFIISDRRSTERLSDREH